MKIYCKQFLKVGASESFFSGDLTTILEFSRCFSASSPLQNLLTLSKTKTKCRSSHFKRTLRKLWSMSADSQYSQWASFSSTSEPTLASVLTNASSARPAFLRREIWTSTLKWFMSASPSLGAPTATNTSQRSSTCRFT